MCEYLRGGAGEGPSGSAGRPSSLSAASDPSLSVTPSLSSAAEVTVPEVTVPEAPRLALGVELLGEFKNSGYSPPPFLVRRPDGQVIQMSRLLYLVAALIDGIRSAAIIAELASADLGRSLGADQVRYIIARRRASFSYVLLTVRVVAIPLAQLGRWCDLLAPLVKVRLYLGEPAWPRRSTSTRVPSPRSGAS